MAKLYKLTDENGQTRDRTQWGPGVSNSGTGKGELCGPGWIHAYTHPLLAVLLSPLHVGFEAPRLWEAEGEIALLDNGLKVGCKTLTTIKEVPLPEITTAQRVAFATICALTVYKGATFAAWAERWLSGEAHSIEAAGAAARVAAWEAARVEAWEAAPVAARAAARAAECAVRAAECAVRAAECAARVAARAAARAAECAAECAAARAAECAAECAAALVEQIDLISIAEKAVREY